MQLADESHTQFDCPSGRGATWVLCDGAGARWTPTCSTLTATSDSDDRDFYRMDC